MQLLAHDDASGVGASYVVTSDNAPPVQYDAPFSVPLYSTVYFQSVDKQGNVEAPQSIVADDAPGYRDLAVPVTIREELKLRRTIFPQGDEDWFRFDANGTTDYRAALDGDNDRYELDLVNADGTVVQTTHRRWHENDEIRGMLAAGTYYLHVFGIGGAADRKHAYLLNVEAHDRSRDHEHGR